MGNKSSKKQNKPLSDKGSKKAEQKKPLERYFNADKLVANGRGFQDGPFEQAKFSAPHGIAALKNGNLVVSDMYNNRIRLIDLEKNTVSTLAGCGEDGFRDGPALEAQFSHPYGICVDPFDRVFVADEGNNRIRCIAEGQVTTLAGDGRDAFHDDHGAAASFSRPRGVTADAAGFIYVADTCNNAVRQISPHGIVTTLAGTGKRGLRNTGERGELGEKGVEFTWPYGLSVDKLGNLLIADSENDCVRLMRPKSPLLLLMTIPALKHFPLVMFNLILNYLQADDEHVETLYHVDKPWGLCAVGNELWVTCRHCPDVMIFTPRDPDEPRVVPRMLGNQSWAQGMCLDRTGKEAVYLTDAAHHQILRIYWKLL